MGEMFDPQEPGDQEQGTFEDLSMVEAEAGLFQRVRRWQGRLPWVSLSLLQLLLNLSFFLVLFIVLARVSRIHQDLQSQTGVPQSEADSPEVQVHLHVISGQLARMNESLERLCRPCSWGWQHFQDSCYLYSRAQAPWSQAVSACQGLDAQLVVVNSAPEEKFLQYWEMRKKSMWIGLSDHHNEGSWQWVDGNPLITSYWRPGEPNNSGDEDCAEVQELGWNDMPCHLELPWACERPASPCPEPSP